METPLWLFQRDEIDVLETELDALWDRHMKHGKGTTEEEAVLKEYADTEDWAETDVLLRTGDGEHGPCEHEEEHRRAFEEMSVEEFLRQGTTRDPLYVSTYTWARRATTWAAEHYVPRTAEAADLFRAQVNALLAPVKLAFAQSGEAHTGRAARESALSDYALALQYLARAAESLARGGAPDLGEQAAALFTQIAAKRAALERGPNASAV